MLQDRPIICQHCKKKTGYTQEQFMFAVITSDIRCPHCGEIVIHANNGIEFGSKPTDAELQNPDIYTSPSNISINTDLNLDE